MMSKFTVDDYLGKTTPKTIVPISPTPSPLAQSSLTKLGKFLADNYQQNKAYRAVNASQTDTSTLHSHHLHSHNTKLIATLLGNAGGKTAHAYHLANKFNQWDNGNTLSKISEQLYSKLSQIAHAWAVKSLAKIDLTSNSYDKHVLAADFANHNRVLVSMGGITGVFGLKGVLADTAWLLLICLKSIYELAYIYDKPINDNDGIALVYGILINCDLNKLQEKQLISTALAIGDTLLKNAKNTSVLDELQQLAQNYQGKHNQKLELLADFIDLDKLGSKWLQRAIAVLSVGATVHYNNVLLEEVLGVAMATFGTNPLLLEN